MKKHIFILISIALMVFFSYCTEEDVNSSSNYFNPEQPGPYSAGFVTSSWEDTSRDRGANLVVWYPCLEQQTSIEDAVIRGTPNISDGPYPLIMFSHGSQGYNQQSTFLTIYLATHGYVVVAPDHPKNTITDYDSQQMGETALQRPQDIIYNLNTALEMDNDSTSFLYKMIDETHIGMMGHSFGAYTTLVISGAYGSIDVGKAYCDINPGVLFCDIYNQIVESHPDMTSFANKDSRIMASVAMAPGGYGLFGENGFSDIQVPMMIMGGSLDTVTPVDTEANNIYSVLGTIKYLVTLEQAQHNAFTDFCGILGTPMSYCPDAKTYISVFSTAFLGLYIKENNEYASFLTPAYAQTLNQITLLTN